MFENAARSRRDFTCFEAGRADGIEQRRPGDRRVILERNRIITPFGSGAVGCTNSMSVVRDNIFMGFQSSIYQCDDNGGNVSVLPPS